MRRLQLAFFMGAIVVACPLLWSGDPGFVANYGQWPEPFQFKRSGQGFVVYAEPGRIRLALTPLPLHWHHAEGDKHKENNVSEAAEYGLGHALTWDFHYASGEKPIPEGRKVLPVYHNYFIGNHPSAWKSGVPVYEELRWHYGKGKCDVILSAGPGLFKYDIQVAPGGQIPEVHISGADALTLRDGRLVIRTALGLLEEYIPKAWQEAEGKRRDIQVVYRLKGNRVQFVLPPDYNPDLPLTIDPALVFSSFVGSGSDSWGFTAAYDALGNGYAGGIVFGSFYPLTPGAFQTTFAGNVDVCITKFNSTGTQLLFSTFFGGQRPEMPYSMIVNSQNELIVLGNTGSSNFPVPPSGYDNSFNGGTAFGYWPNGFNGFLANYNQGSDLFVAKFSANGQQLLASTFVGGTANDGINSAGGLNFNYADDFRGEVIVDANDNVLCITSTQSSDFPVANGFQSTYGGVQDAVVFKLSPNLNTLIWSSFWGGSEADAGYGIKVNSLGQAYFCGGTRSSNLPGMVSGAQPSNAGNRDGYIVRISASGNAVLAATYVGTSAYDQAYFLELDQQERPYVLGQTLGAMGQITGASGTIFGHPNRGLFIRRYAPDLSQVTLSTTIGNSPNAIALVPTAFLVDECNYIFFSGWAGQVNLNYNVQCSTQGLPVTPGAHKTGTDGSDFYFCMLTEEAATLLYGTFFGGDLSHEHVDGGTSRFDKKGVVYQAICAGCGGYSDMYSTPGAFSAVNGSSNCNLALVKFDVSELSAQINATSFGYVCIGQQIQFQNQSIGATHYLWLFGDGTTSTQTHPAHTYSTPGTYTVTLIAYNSNSCTGSDTAFLDVNVLGLGGSLSLSWAPVCQGQSVTLNASGGTQYQWLPAPGLPSAMSTSANPVVTPPYTTTYTVLISSPCGLDTLHITVPVVPFQVSTSPDDTLCLGQAVQIWASGGQTYQWYPPAGLSDPFLANPLASPVISTTYVVTVTDLNNCSGTDTVHITVEDFPQAQILQSDTVLCFGQKITLQAAGGTAYTWFPPSAVFQQSGASAVISPQQDTDIIVTVSNACGQDRDTIRVGVRRVVASAGPDTTVCLGTPVTLYAYGGVRYRWEPSWLFQDNTQQFPTVDPQLNQIFWVWAYDSLNCSDADSLYIGFHPAPQLTLGPDRFIEFGGATEIQAGVGAGHYAWYPVQGLSCSQCALTLASPLETTQYTVTFTDENGCTFKDSLWVIVEGILYIPNTFTPGNDELNEVFKPVFTDVVDLKMYIFNRWGEKIWESRSLNDGWNGMAGGLKAPSDVYVWVLDYTLNSGRSFRRRGHVLLLR
ncbi:MAG: gliding motility-associated C-terminal domain-containing protein [Flavobacteriales bacterium]|nr:gliding motility-associated C-terminal domain-containing protein [Flavobacteriales bacterium]